MPYMPRLDGLRGIAIIGVLLEHFCPNGKIRAVSPGGAGVTLFFVLSGYLITRILLQYRLRKIRPGTAAIQFYARRLLRLSPPYYVAIAVALVFGLQGIRAKWWVPALYLTNFHIALRGGWTGTADHFWSLAVEEQFYLLWFVVVVVLPARYFIPAVVTSMLATLGFRLGTYAFSLTPLMTVLLVGQMAVLASGALVAWAEIHEHALLQRIFLSRSLLIFSALVFAGVSVSLPYRLLFPRVVLYPFAGLACFACLVRQSACSSRQPWLEWLSWKPLRHIGKISYGIFVYHMFIPRSAVAFVVGESPWAVFGGLVIASIVVAQISWVVMEQPVLKLKDRFTIADARRPKAPKVYSAVRPMAHP